MSTSESIGLKEQDFTKLVSLLSHDLRGSIRALKVLPDWIEEDLAGVGQADNSELNTHIRMMRTHANRLENMVVDVTEYVRLEMGETPDWVEVNSRAQAVLKSLAPSDCAPHSEIGVERVLINAAHLDAVLTALIHNAVTHGPSEEPAVALRIIAEHDHVAITVLDNGKGVPRDMCARAEQPLITLRPRDEVEGSGMGLAKVSKIAQLYRGTLTWVEHPETGALMPQVRLPISYE